jgi:dihydroorotase
MASPCGWTPFDGLAVTGWPVTTIVRGEIVMREGAIIGEPKGQKIGFR